MLHPVEASREKGHCNERHAGVPCEEGGARDRHGEVRSLRMERKMRALRLRKLSIVPPLIGLLALLTVLYLAMVMQYNVANDTLQKFERFQNSSPMQVLESSDAISGFTAKNSTRLLPVVKCIHHHLFFHGGTTLCSIAANFNPRVRTPIQHKNSPCWSSRLDARQLAASPFDFTMNRDEEADKGVSERIFPHMHPSPSILYSVTMRHPLPFVMKIMKSARKNGSLKGTFHVTSDNQDLRCMLPPKEEKSVGCERPDSKGAPRGPYGEEWRRCLPLAKANLLRFDVVLILDHYAETLRLMCAKLKWTTCADLGTSSASPDKQQRYIERHNDILGHVRSSWPRNASDIAFPGMFISVGEALDRNSPGIDLFDFALKLSSDQLREHGLEPGFTVPS